MKKTILILFLILLCSSCKMIDISESLFIASIGFAKEEESLVGYFYLPMSSDVGKTEGTDNKGEGEYARVRGDSVAVIINNIIASNSLEVNLKHVSSVIISYELLTADFINELADYIKYSANFDFNCYVFSTKEKISDIYSFQNPNKESVLNSILILSGDEKGVSLVCESPHFLQMIRRFKSNRNVFIPMLDLEEIWVIESNKQACFHPQGAVYYFQGQTFLVEKNPSSPFVKSTAGFYDKIDQASIYFFDYKFHVNYISDFTIRIDFNYYILESNNIVSQEDIKELVYSRVISYYNEFSQADPLDLEYYNQIYNKEYTYDDLKVVINVLNN